MNQRKKSSKARSKAFHATRRQHNLEAAEDYTELVADLIEEKGEARTCDIADHLGISHVTALRTLQRLQRDGYVNTAPRKPIKLTAKGKKLAKQCKERHALLYNFLIKIGVPEHIAKIDVEGLEHHISKETLDVMRKYIKKA